MGKREVKTEYVRKAVKELKELREECEGYYTKEIELNSEEQGAVHNALGAAGVIMSDTWKEFIILINRTMEFLGEAVDAYEIPDQKSAGKIGFGQISCGGGFRGENSNTSISGGGFR